MSGPYNPNLGGKIFNIGLNRAGTSSLTEALRILGFRAAHFRVDGQRIFDVMHDNHAQQRRLLDGLDQRFDAFSDFAANSVVDTLDRQYPHSVFIVTLRDLSSWLDSRERKVRKNRADPNYRYAFLDIDRDGWARGRAHYLAAVDNYFSARPGDLLKIDIPGGDGWEPLCAFLGCAIPDAPFPRLNQS